MYSAYITQVDNNLKDKLSEGLDFIDWKRQVRKDSIVFIKPNFTFPRYMEGITTTPELLRNLLEILKDRAGNVIVGESNGGDHSFTADESEREAQETFSKHNTRFSNLARRALSRKSNYIKHPKILIRDVIKGLKMAI